MAQLSLGDSFEYNFQEKLHIKYEGENPELIQHEIDAITYAISIAGYSKFLTLISSKLFERDIEIRISANKPGSFEAMVIVLGSVGSIASILGWCGIKPSDLKQGFKTFIIAIQKKIVGLLVKNKGDVTLVSKDIDSIPELTEIEKDVIKKLISDNDFRKSLDDFTSPLDRRGYTNIEIANDNRESLNVSSVDRQIFKFVPPDSIEEESFHDIVSIVYLSPDLPVWQFKGQRLFWAEIMDEEFLVKTKNKKPAELKDKKFSVMGSKIITTKGRSGRVSFSWVIDKIYEVNDTRPLFKY